MNGETIGVGKIDRYEIEPAFHKLRNEIDAASQAIKASDDQDGSHDTAEMNGLVKTRPIVLEPA